LPDGDVFDPFAGSVLPLVPGWVVRLDHAGRLPVRLGSEQLVLGGALGLGFVAERPLPLGQHTRALLETRLALSARLRFAELGLALSNVFDAQQRATELYYASNFSGPDEPASLRPMRHFAAAPPFQALLRLTLYFEDEPPFAQEGT
jgi:hypothetical protein